MVFAHRLKELQKSCLVLSDNLASVAAFFIVAAIFFFHQAGVVEHKRQPSQIRPVLDQQFSELIWFLCVREINLGNLMGNLFKSLF